MESLYAIEVILYQSDKNGALDTNEWDEDDVHYCQEGGLYEREFELGVCLLPCDEAKESVGLLEDDEWVHSFKVIKYSATEIDDIDNEVDYSYWDE